jgi:integrase
VNERSDGHIRPLPEGDWMFGVRLGSRRRYLKRRGYPTKTAALRAKREVLELVAVGRGDDWFTDRIVERIFDSMKPGRTLPNEDELRRLRGAGLDPTTPSKLVADYAREWLATKADRRPSTQAILRHRVEHHIAPSELGALPLDRVTRTDVKEFLDTRTTLAARARQQLRATLKSIFQMAVEDGLVPRNPAAQVKTPPPPTKRPATWTRDERDRFLTHIDGDPLHPLLVTMVRTGLRRGEACGLRWCDIDLDAADPYLWVEQQVTLGPAGTFEVGDPKTKDSRRTVMLDPATVAVLRQHKSDSLVNRMALGLGRPHPMTSPSHPRTTAGRRGCRPCPTPSRPGSSGCAGGPASRSSPLTACATPTPRCWSRRASRTG